MWDFEKQHWKIWYVYAEVQNEAQRLAQITEREVVFKPWRGGWVIFNLRNLFDLMHERLADEAESEERYREAMDDGNARQSREEADESTAEMQDGFARSGEDGWFYAD